MNKFKNYYIICLLFLLILILSIILIKLNFSSKIESQQFQETPMLVISDCCGCYEELESLKEAVNKANEIYNHKFKHMFIIKKDHTYNIIVD